MAIDNHHEMCDGGNCDRWDCAGLPENVLPIVTEIPAVSTLLAEFDQIQSDRRAREDELEELDNGSVRDAETRRDILDGWVEAESEIAHKLVALLRGEGK